MKKILLGAAVAMLGIAPALAADMAPRYTKAPMAAPVAVYNWTGFYVGGNLGYGWRDTDVSLYTLGGVPILLPPASTGQRVDGFIGGGQVGYNWQTGMWVFGIEADAAWRNGSSTTTFAFPNAPLNDVTTFNTKETWLATVRPRAGVAVNNWLLYVTGGAAFEGLQHTVTENRTSVAGGIRSYTSDDARVGWTVGAGVEAGFGSWSIGAEYLYANFGNRTIVGPAVTVATVPFPVSSTTFNDNDQHIVRVKANYHFNAPVVAKY
jgi:outer membrane immunogenic protein